MSARRAQLVPDARDLVVVGASAGGVDALCRLVARLPSDYPGTVLVVLHLAPHGKSVLPEILARVGAIAVSPATDGEPLRPGTVVVAPPDFHLLVRDGALVLSAGLRENGHRPSIDLLFRSAARALGARVVGVVLSGVLDDGTNGLRAIKRRGGVAIVQDPADAQYPDMPRSAIDNVAVDHVVAVDDVAPLLQRYARESAPSPLVSAPLDVGFDARREDLENALWTALHTLEERSVLARRLADDARGRRNLASARQFSENADDAAAKAEVIRAVLEERPRQPPRPTHLGTT